jgi:hypothetical protein
MDTIYTVCVVLLITYLVGIICFKSHQTLFKTLINYTGLIFIVLSSVYVYLYTSSIIYTIIYIPIIIIVIILVGFIVGGIRGIYKANRNLINFDNWEVMERIMRDRARELRELWYATDLYRRLAESLVQQNNCQGVSLGELSDQFENHLPDNAPLTELITHISSASIRMSTAFDILEDENRRNSLKVIMRNKKLTDSQIKIELDRSLPRYVAHMLRDEVGHPERDARWKLRQEYLRLKKVCEIYEAFRESVEELKARLVEEGIITN